MLRLSSRLQRKMSHWKSFEFQSPRRFLQKKVQRMLLREKGLLRKERVKKSQLKKR